MIRLELTGNLGGDAEVREHEGWNIISFSVADTFKKKDGTQVTTWVTCSIWKIKDLPLTVVPYLKKGVKIFVAGTPSASAFLGKDGAARAEMKLRVSDYELQSFPDNETSTAPTTAAQVNTPNHAPIESPNLPESDDLPF